LNQEYLHLLFFGLSKLISSKGHFPFLFNDIIYKGLLPKFEYWTGISRNEYDSLLLKYTGIVWNFKDEALKYCKLDCKTLYEILIKFNELIYTSV
jgi:DNA polymerase type B, organellar and viral